MAFVGVIVGVKPITFVGVNVSNPSLNIRLKESL